jgi:hypothetical protein
LSELEVLAGWSLLFSAFASDLFSDLLSDLAVGSDLVVWLELADLRLSVTYQPEPLKIIPAG